MAASLVLLSHLGQIEARTVTAPLLSPATEWGNMGVDLFFVISGFIMVYITRDWGRPSINRIPEFLFARISRIYPLYWIVSAALLLVWWIRPDLVFSSSGNDPQLLNSLFLIPAYAYPLLEVGWTLVYEMIFYLFFAVLLVLPSKARGWTLVMTALIITAGYFAGFQSGSALQFHLFSPLVLEFLAGAFTGIAFLKLKGSKTLGMTLAGLGLIGLFIWFFLGTPFQDQAPRVWRLTLPACAVVLGAAWLDRHEIRASRFAVTLGDWSYSLYLTHLLSLGLVSQMWGLVGWTSVWAGLFLIAALFFIIAIAGLTYRWVEAPLIHRSKRLRLHFFSGP